jgi:hypothetical protein
MVTKERKDPLTFREYAAFTSFAGKNQSSATTFHLPLNLHSLSVCFAPNNIVTPKCESISHVQLLELAQNKVLTHGSVIF